MRVGILCSALFLLFASAAPAQWDAAKWSGQAAIEIDYSAGSRDLERYQVRVGLDEKSLDFKAARPDGADLRLVDRDGRTLLPYWIERFDPADRQAVVWVCVPALAAGQKRVVHLHYGNPAAAPASDGRATFEFFDDCEQGRPDERWQVVRGKIQFKYLDAYSRFGRPGGVWHRSGAKTRVSPGGLTVYGGPHATYCSWTRPMAIYAPEVDKTFFAFGNAENHPTVCAYDHRRNALEPAVTVGRNPDGDAHKNPHLLIDEQGYLYAFYRAHCTPTHLAKSLRPLDISAWQPMGVVCEQSSYPQPWQLRQGEISVFYRSGSTHNAGESVVRSRDGGRTWTKPQLIAQSPPKNGLYALTIAPGGPWPRKIHMAWSVTRGDWWQRYHVFYASSDDGGVTWRRSDGRPYQLPITEADAEMVFRSDVPDRGVWLQDMQLDASGRLYVLFVDGHTLTYDCAWRVATLADGRWSVHRLTGCDHMYDHGALVVLAENDLRAYLPSTPSQAFQDGGQIVERQSLDRGVTWKTVRQVTASEKYSHNHVKTVYNQRHGDFRVFWSYGDSTDPPQTREVSLYRGGEALCCPEKLEPAYAPEKFPGRLMVVGQPERIDSTLAIKNLSLSDAAIAARVMPGPPEKHGMLCARIGPSGALYGGGLADGRAKLYRYQDRWRTLAEQKLPGPAAGWHDWELRAFGDHLQMSLDAAPLAEAQEASLTQGALGIRVSSTELLLDDIRVRRLVLPEPVARVRPR